MKKSIILWLAKFLTPGQILGLISELIKFAPAYHVHLQKTRPPRKIRYPLLNEERAPEAEPENGKRGNPPAGAPSLSGQDLAG